ncbi:hypothetical protein [Streptomyces paradoxus]|uniref:hypothetical protein n=1 Tax=Streptomyces paradoxus TaxID=66375 RepID=UPI0035E41711
MPFSVIVPWETPVTGLHGQSLGVVLGVRTELSVAGRRTRATGATGRAHPLPFAPGPVPPQRTALSAHVEREPPPRLRQTGRRLGSSGSVGIRPRAPTPPRRTALSSRVRRENPLRFAPAPAAPCAPGTGLRLVRGALPRAG